MICYLGLELNETIIRNRYEAPSKAQKVFFLDYWVITVALITQNNPWQFGIAMRIAQTLARNRLGVRSCLENEERYSSAVLSEIQ